MAAANPIDANQRHSDLMTRYHPPVQYRGLIHAGAFGQIFLEETPTQELFVQKKFQDIASYALEKDAIQEINRERPYPCIIRLSGYDDANYILNYPYYKNGSLGDLLHSHNQHAIISFEDIIAWLIDIACALEFLHQFHELPDSSLQVAMLFDCFPVHKWKYLVF